MSNNPEKTAPEAGSKTRAKLKFLDGLSAFAVLLLILEFWLYSEDRFGAVALWLLVVVILSVQILKMRIRCPHCAGSVYRSWRYSYRSKVPNNCSHCHQPLP